MSLRDLTPWARHALARNDANWHPLTRFHQELDRMFDNLWRGTDLPDIEATVAAAAIRPDVDIEENDNEYRVTAELPGVEEKDIEVKLDDHVLTIRGEKKVESERKDKKYNIVERSYGSFERSFRLGGEVAEDKVQAVFKNGVLSVTLPKSEKAKVTSRKVPISAK